MSRTPDDLADDAVARAITEALAYAGMRESQRGLVQRYLHDDPAEWMNCCNSSCDPCVLTIGTAVGRARQLLGLPPFPRREF